MKILLAVTTSSEPETIMEELVSDISLARQKITQVMAALDAEGGHDEHIAELQDALALTFRRRAARRAPRRSVQVTPEIREQVIELATTTELHSSEIAASLGVNPGRVSEILQGDR